MTTVTAVKSGDWSDPTVWSAPPASGDTVKPAGFTVTIDTDIDIGTGTLSNSSTGGAFEVTAARNIVANITGGTQTCVVLSHTSGTVAITGNITGGSATGARGVQHNGTGAVTITGNLTGGSGAGNTSAFYNADVGAVAVTGNVTGGSNTAACGLFNLAAATVTISGNATGGGGSQAYGADNNGGGSLTVQGAAIGNAYGPGGSDSNPTAGVRGSNSSGAVTAVVTTKAGAYGQAPVYGAVKIYPASNSSTWRRSDTGAELTLTGGFGQPVIGSRIIRGLGAV